jgi:putative redox protein
MFVSKVTYTGELRTEAVHIASGNTIITDAPVDNHGKGMAFSPTDLVSTALASCMFTVIGIAGQTHGFDLSGSTAHVTKMMANDPRRISEIHVKLEIIDRNLTDKQKAIIEHTARTCPVLYSLSTEIQKHISFEYLPT